MSQNVWTTLGEISDELLERTVTQEEGHNYFKVTTTWRLKDHYLVNGEVAALAGEIVRQDQAPSILRGPSSESSQGVMG